MPEGGFVLSIQHVRHSSDTARKISSKFLKLYIDSKSIGLNTSKNRHHWTSEVTHDSFAGYGHDGYKATKDLVALLYCAGDIGPVPHPFL
jgi:hypothetical protein